MMEVHRIRGKGEARGPAVRVARCALAILLAVMLAIPVNMLHPFLERAYANESVYLDTETGHYAKYGGYSTRVMYADDNIVYCAQPSKKTPRSGYYEKEPLYTKEVNGNQWSTTSLSHILWYGYGGPGFDPSMWPDTDEKGEPLTSDIYIAVTHILISDVFACDAGPALTGCTRAFREWIGNGIMAYDSITDTYNDWSLQQAMINNVGPTRCPGEFVDSCFCLSTGGGSYQITVSFTPGGWIDLEKTSAIPSITERNACYSLQDARYTIHADAACTSPIEDLITDENGYAKSGYLPQGTYYVRESAPSRGYALDAAVYEVRVSNGTTSRVNEHSALEAPQSCPAEMWIAKVDGESGEALPLGSATLEGAEFTVRYYDGFYGSAEDAEASGAPNRSWVVSTDEQGHARLEDPYVVGGDPLYRNSNGKPTIPLGTVLIQETKPPTGYLLGEPEVFVECITGGGNAETVRTYAAPTRENQVKRGDIEFIKVRELDQKRLAFVPFRLTSQTTGESHIIVTDENGYANTAAEWNFHTYMTDFNDDVERLGEDYDPERGVWFGKTPDGNSVEADDSLGALPYDSYTLEELPAPANEGCELITLEDICIRRDHVILDLGTIEDPMQSKPYIHTTATDAHDGDRIVAAGSAALINDHVEYMNLIPRETYTLYATLHSKRDGTPLENASAVHTFTPTAVNGYVDVSIPVELLEADAEEVVVFERLELDGVSVAIHEDITDTEQTIRVCQPSIATNAHDALDGDKQIVGHRTSTIIDTVDYNGLAAGGAYNLTATVMIEGAEDEPRTLLDEKGIPVEGSVSFSPDDSYGSIDVGISLDSSALRGQRLTVFERLTEDGRTIATHEEIMDEAQTVEVIAPHLSTAASDGKDDDKVVVADEGARVIDRVSLFDVLPDHLYRIYGMVLDPTTGLPLMGAPGEDPDDEAEIAAFYRELLDALGLTNLFPENDGASPMRMRSLYDPMSIDLPLLPDWERVEFVIDEHGDLVAKLAMDTKDITPEASRADLTMDYGFDARGLDGEAVVCELLVEDGAIVSVHADLADKNQTVEITRSLLATSASDKTDGDKTLLPSKDATIIDKVSYEDLIEGQEYELQGHLMDRTTGKELLIGDAPVTATLKFTPNESSGTIDVLFPFDASNITVDKELVVFERLFKNGEIIATHEDIDSDAQTVTLSRSPLGKGYAKTGGSFGPLMVALIALSAIAITAGILLARGRFHWNLPKRTPITIKKGVER